MDIRLKRAYEPPARGDGARILVERLWPRGMKKEALEMDAWLKEVAPSTELRRWFGHRVERWAEFRKRYRDSVERAGGRLTFTAILLKIVAAALKSHPKLNASIDILLRLKHILNVGQLRLNCTVQFSFRCCSVCRCNSIDGSRTSRNSIRRDRSRV